MRAIPAVDLREGRCVQLVGGRPEEERVSLPDPVAAALSWERAGFRTLHIVDLDAALGLGSNRGLIQEIVRAGTAEVQAGGGIRSEEEVARLLATGVARVIVGTRAIDDPDWLRRVTRDHSGRVVVAADTREGRVLRKGWTESTGLLVEELLERLAPLPLAGVLCTDVAREGRMEGIDLAAALRIIEDSPHPLWISGGITTVEELRALKAGGAAGAVLGMALYTGVLDPQQVAEEFGG